MYLFDDDDEKYNPMKARPHNLYAFFLALFIYSNLYATTYYVTTSGSSSNNGLTEENSWTLTHAFNQAVAGDIVYVKAGNYGNLNIRSQRNGTASNPIKFIGYTTSPGDIAAVDEYSTYTYADFDADNAVLPSNIMPLIQNNRGSNNDPDSSDRAFYILHEYIHIENFMMQYHDTGIRISDANATVINCIVNEVGNWDPNNPGWNQSFSGSEPNGNLSGYGIHATSSGDNFTLKSSTVFNAGADAIFIVGASYHKGDYNSIYADKSGNSMDYHYCLYGVDNAELNHNRSFRFPDRDTGQPLPHRSRALALKGASNDNVVNDFYAYGCRVLVYQRSNDNRLNDVVMDGTDESFTTTFIIADNSNRNIITNLHMKKGYIGFNDYKENTNDYDGTGSDNIFYNSIIDEVPDETIGGGFINIGNSIWSNENSTMIDAGTNYFIGGTWYNAKYFMVQDRPVVNFVFKNMLFGNVSDRYKDSNAGGPQSGAFTFENCNFDNTNFTTPAGTNLTTFDPLFTNEDNKDFTLTESSPAIDSGVNTSESYPLSNTDFDGVSRPQGNGFDIGAYEKKNENSSSITANAGNDITICEGDSTTLTATGGGSYSWSNGENTASITVNPTETTTYTVTVSDGTNSDTDEVIVTVNPLPIANAGEDTTINNGESITLTATGGDSYSWSNGENTASITVNPSDTTTYAVTVTSNSCSSTDDVIVTVNTLLTADAGNDITICEGDSTTLTATGGDSYSWSNGENTASITVNPTETTTYTVTVSDGTNSDTDEVIVTVNSLPIVDAGDNVTINTNESITLTATGGVSCIWSTGETTESIVVSPSDTTTYSVTIFSDGGCNSSDEVVVTVNPLPIAYAGEDVTINRGESINLNATGGGTYFWSNGDATSNTTVNPTHTTIYTVTVYDGTNFDTDNVKVTVNNPGKKSLGNQKYENLNFTLYPNPSNDGNFIIKLPTFENKIIVTIYDTTGKLIQEKEFTNGESLSLNVNLSSGFYFVRTFTGQKLGTQKLIVY